MPNDNSGAVPKASKPITPGSKASGSKSQRGGKTGSQPRKSTPRGSSATGVGGPVNPMESLMGVPAAMLEQGRAVVSAMASMAVSGAQQMGNMAAAAAGAGMGSAGAAGSPAGAVGGAAGRRGGGRPGAVCICGAPRGAEEATRMMNQLYSLVQNNLPNPQALGGLAELFTAGVIPAEAMNRLSAAMFDHTGIGPAVVNTDAGAAAMAVTRIMEDPRLLEPLAQIFGNGTVSGGVLVADKILLSLLLHVMVNVAQPFFHKILQTISGIVPDLAKDDVGKKILDVAADRACPENKIRFMKSMDYSSLDEDTKSTMKEFLLKSFETATTDERQTLLQELFPYLFKKGGDPEEQKLEPVSKDAGKLLETLVNVVAADQPAGSDNGQHAPLESAVEQLFSFLENKPDTGTA